MHENNRKFEIFNKNHENKLFGGNLIVSNMVHCLNVLRILHRKSQKSIMKRETYKVRSFVQVRNVWY